MGARTWGADVAGPASVASTLGSTALATGAPSTYDATAQSREREGGGDGSDKTEAMLADRKGLKGIYRDFRALGLTCPELVKGDVADTDSRVRQPE